MTPGNASPTDRRWMKVSDVAELTGLSTYTVRQAAADGHLVGHKRAGAQQTQWRFTQDDVDAWMTGKTAKAGAA